MELKKYKRLKNGLPGFVGGKDEMFRHLGTSKSNYVGAGWIGDLTKDIYAQMQVENMMGKTGGNIFGESMDEKYKLAWTNIYKDEYNRPQIDQQKKEGLVTQNKADYGDIAGNVVNTIGSIYKAFQPTYGKNELLNNATYGTSYRYGVPYSRGSIDFAAMDKNSNERWWNKVFDTSMSGYNLGSSIGSNLPSAKNGKLPSFAIGSSGALGLAGAIAAGSAGIFGASLARFKELEAQQEAKEQLNRENMYRSDIAGTLGIQLKYSDYNKPFVELMLRFSCGKLPKFEDGKKRVRSPFGLINADANAKVDRNEILREWSPDGTYVIAESRIPNRGKGVDTYLAHIDELTEIIPSKIVNMMDKMKGYKCGKLPKYSLGSPKYNIGSNADNSAIMLAGIGAGLDQFVKSTEDVGGYNFAATNPGIAPGMRALNSLHISPYPIMGSLSKMYAKGKYGIRNSGASGGLQDAQYQALQNSLYNNMYNMYMQNQAQNNAYIADAAKTGITANEQQTARNQQANIAARQLSDRAMANKYSMRQGGIFNALKAWQQYVKNKKLMEQFKLMYGLYSDDLDIKKQAIKDGRYPV